MRVYLIYRYLIYRYSDCFGNPLFKEPRDEHHSTTLLPKPEASLYDTQTRSLLQTDRTFPTIGSQDSGIQKNADGSYDVYFAPEAPKGMEGNWVQAVPGKSWFTILRMYGPLEPWINKTWRPGEIEAVE